MDQYADDSTLTATAKHYSSVQSSKVTGRLERLAALNWAIQCYVTFAYDDEN